MTNAKKNVADSVSLLRRGKPLSSADRLNVCAFLDSLTETNIKQAAAIKDLLAKPEAQLAAVSLRDAAHEVNDLSRELESVGTSYMALVQACRLNCDTRTLENLAMVTQECALLPDFEATEEYDL